MKVVSSAVFVLLAGGIARGEVTLLLEEPFGSFWSGNPAHISVYFSRVCAESPLVLRRCAPGEAGAVISRYHRMHGYDWVAMPLIPYLYSVERSGEVPRQASREDVQHLRETYRAGHLAEITRADSRDWPQLVGEAYDRTLYGFTLPTTEQQDDELIRRLNQRPNRNHFNIVFRNCANFAARIVDFFYPGAARRSVWTAGILIPKQVAVDLIHFSARHPELAFSVFEIRQVPGETPRSKRIHGIWSMRSVSGAACGNPGFSLPTLVCPAAAGE